MVFRLLFGAGILLAPLSTLAQTTAPAVPTATSTPPTVPIVAVEEVKKALLQPGAVLLDVRTPEEYAAGHLPGAQNLNFRAADFSTLVAQLDPKVSYIIYCASGNRSSKTILLMQDKGFEQLINAGAYTTLLKGGVKK